MVQDDFIKLEDLKLRLPPKREGRSKLKELSRDVKKELIQSTLHEYQHNISQTARALGISRPYLHVLIKRMSIHIPKRKA